MNIQTNVPYIKCRILLGENTKRLNLKTESTNEFIFYCNPSKDFCVVFIVFLRHTVPHPPPIYEPLPFQIPSFPVACIVCDLFEEFQTTYCVALQR